MIWASKIIAALATAASLAVVYLGLSQFVGGAAAFAEVVEILNKVRTATWKISSEVKTPEGNTITWSGTGMFLAPSHERTEMNVQGATTVQIMDGQRDQIVTLVPASKTAIVIDLKNVPPEGRNPVGKSFLGLRKLAAMAQAGEVEKVERLEATTIDGRAAQGFRILMGAIEVKVWADPGTLLPVRVEERTTSEPVTNVVMSDFRVDAPLDEALFSLELPAGYSVQQTTQFDFTKKPVTYLADTLKIVAERNAGVFPATLRGTEGIDGILIRTAKESAGKYTQESPEEARKRGTELAMKLGATFGFLFSLSPENDWHYAGKDVKLDTPNRAIFWYRTDRESANYQVLYADLSIKEVAAEDMPKTAPTEGNPQL